MSKKLSKKVVVFDFDKTLTHEDTFRYFLICHVKVQYKFLISVFYYFQAIIYKLKLINLITFKKNCLKFLGLFDTKKTSFRNPRNMVRLNEKVCNLLENEAKLNRVIIVSASPTFFIKYFFPEVEVYGMEFDYNPIRIHSHPFKEEKVKLLQNKNIQSVEAFYTDSYNDQPLMNISSKVFLIARNEIRCLKDEYINI